ncbi:MAG: ATP-grasp domain-containing protein [Bdellovibrionota bacterium]
MKKESRPRVVVVVDGYSSGGLYPDDLRAQGVSCVHVESGAYIPPALFKTFDQEKYLKTFAAYEARNLQDLVSSLKREYEVLGVVSGTETGVELTDRLANAFGLPGNPIETSALKRDKAKMVSALASKGLRCIQSLSTKSADEALAWVRGQTQFPVIVKPLKSAGTDGVEVCADESALRNAFKTKLGKLDAFKNANDSLLVQELIVGAEYIVDTVSIEGLHYLNSVWKYRKARHGAHVLYEVEELLEYSAPEVPLIFEYLKKVLDALELQFGPGHSELFIDERGPVLVETGARPNGVGGPRLSKRAVGLSQIDLTVEAILRPDEFRKRIGTRYEVSEFCLRAYFISEADGVLKQIKNLDRIEALPSFARMDLEVETGGALQKTTDLFSSPGSLDFFHKDRAQLWKDYEAFQKIETDGVFIV